MKETKFIEQNREKWTDFEQMLRENHRDPDKLNNLFIQITDDLSYARTFYPNRSVRVFLNSLGQRIFHNIYKGKRFPVERFKLFWTDELPRIMWQTRKALLLSFIIFVLAFSIGVLSSILNPDFARIILGDGYVDMTLENIQKGDPMAVYKQSGPLGMTAGIAANNLFVAFRTAILGVLASIGTVLIMLYNGIMVGAFQYFFVEKGVFWQSFLTIWIHGTLEISAIIIAGAAGLVAGSGLLFPGTYRRMQAFQISMRQGLKIFIGIVPIILLAAIFEGFLTRYTDTPDVIRAAFIGVSLFFVLWYFVWLPWHKHRSGGFGQAEQAKELPPDRQETIDFQAVKSAGEILGDAFTLMRRQARMLWGATLGATALFIVYVVIFSKNGLYETFHYPSDLWGVLDGASGFFRNSEVPFIRYFQWVLLGVLTVVAFKTVEKERFSGKPGETDGSESAQPLRKAVIALAPITILLMPCLVEFIADELGVVGWVVSMAAYPIISLCCAVLYFESLNPAVAIERTVKMTRLGPLLTLGFLSVNLGVMVFLFLDTPVWEMTLELFRWMVPPDPGAMTRFSGVVTTVVAAWLIYLFYSFLAYCGAFLFFSFREIADARSLYNEMENVGVSRKIRGLPRE